MNLQETLKHYFGYDSLRLGQQELIDEILKGKDVLGIMPTGAGKSLCYQLPALMMGEKHSREKTLQLQEDEVNVPCVPPPGITINCSSVCSPVPLSSDFFFFGQKKKKILRILFHISVLFI